MLINWGTHEMEKFSNVNELVNTLKPVNPVYCIRPETIKNSIKIFKEKHPNILVGCSRFFSLF